MNIIQLVDDLESKKALAKDYIVPASKMQLVNNQLNIITDDDVIKLTCNKTFNEQVANKLDIPLVYYKKCFAENSEMFASSILDDNVNYWLKKSNQNFLVRTFQNAESGINIARAFLSDRYKCIDNYDLVITVLQGLEKSNIRLICDSADLTDDKLFIRFIAPDIEVDAPELLRNYKPTSKGKSGSNGIVSGFIISNSETGKGSYKFTPRLKVLACSNGMIRNDESTASVHLGKKTNDIGLVNYSLETKQKELELIQSELVDLVRAVASKDYINKIVSELTLKGSEPIQNVQECILNVGSELKLTQIEKSALMNRFINSGIFTAFGVASALTEIAQTADAETREYYESSVFSVIDNISTYDKPAFNINSAIETAISNN